MSETRSKGPSPARRIATEVLRRVATDGAWASRTLDAEIRRGRLDRRDAALATEIVYGALRVLPDLDKRLEGKLKRSKRIDPLLRAALRVGAYQLQHLGRVPAHAAVSDAVTLVRQQRGGRLSGVANAVLRRLADERPEAPEPPRRVMVPRWLDERLREALGEARHEAFLGARRMPPPLGLRVMADREAWVTRFSEAEPSAEVAVSQLVPTGVLVRGAGDPRSLPGYEQGAFAVQEVGSQRVVELVGAEPGERIADLCAGRGTKSLALAGAGAEVTAVDLYEEKLVRLAGEAERLGIERPPEVLAIDLSVGTGGLAPRSFDRVLLDAPCTGLGTVHRRPEILLRVTPEDPARLAALQSTLLRAARTLVRDGGVLTYAVCSPTREEGAAVAEAFEAEERAATRDADEAIGPWSGEDLDAYQVFRWRIG